MATVCLCWFGASLWSGPAPTRDQAEAANPLGLQRSAYGSLLARLMKESMHNYWHAGRSEVVRGQAPAPNAGVTPETPSAPPQAWLERVSARLSELEELRTTPTSQLPISPAHRRYLDATATWHLRMAYRLDPGDAALYEILHFTAMSRATSPEEARGVAQKLAKTTIAHALSSQGGLSAALTGAGAAINLLNNDLQTGAQVPATPQELLRQWGLLNQCLSRYRQLRQEAEAEEWWAAIPSVRQKELGAYAALVQKISGTIARKLTAMEVLKP